MSQSRVDFFLQKALGEDFFESLTKFELWKPGTRTTVDHEEIKTALKIVPRAIMALLIAELAPMQIGENKSFMLPSGIGKVNITKHERDVYSGDVEENNKKIVDFKYRSIPGVGLVVMSAFELYDIDELHKQPQQPIAEDITAKVQHLIDERLALHALIGKVVDNKIEHRDAVQQLVLAKLTEKHNQVAEIRKIHERSTPQSDPYFRGMSNGLEVANSIVNEKEPKFVESPKKKQSPLKDFLAKRQEKVKKNEFNIKMAKGEQVCCDSCGKEIFSETAYSGCICMGDDMDSKIYIKKTEEGVKIRFPKSWDPENIEMLLEVLRNKRG